MDQIKIGKFIAECRKNNNLTQIQLAEKLNITDWAISKWENIKALLGLAVVNKRLSPEQAKFLEEKFCREKDWEIFVKCL